MDESRKGRAPRVLMFFGILGVATSLWMNSHLTERSGFGDLVVSMFIRSVSLAFLFIPISVVTLSNLPPEKRGNGTGLFNLTKELGGSIGTAWMGSSIDRLTKIHGSYLAESVNPYNPLAQEQYGAVAGTLGTQTATSALVPETMLAMKVKLQAMVLAFQDSFTAATIVFLGCLLLLVFLQKPQGGPVAGAH